MIWMSTNLRHVTNSGPRDAASGSTRLSAQDPYFTGFELSSSHDASQQCCFAAAARSQQPIAENNKQKITSEFNA